MRSESKYSFVTSCVIPAYNADTTIHRAVDSAVNQTTKEPYEILLMDDGFTDSTSQIADGRKCMTNGRWAVITI